VDSEGVVGTDLTNTVVDALDPARTEVSSLDLAVAIRVLHSRRGCEE
jgi:hypothetical protein